MFLAIYIIFLTICPYIRNFRHFIFSSLLFILYCYLKVKECNTRSSNRCATDPIAPSKKKFTLNDSLPEVTGSPSPGQAFVEVPPIVNLNYSNHFPKNVKNEVKKSYRII